MRRWTEGRAVMAEAFGYRGWRQWKEGLGFAWGSFKMDHARRLDCGCSKWGPFSGSQEESA